MSGLPEIGGIIPVGVVTKVKGTGQRIEEALNLGQRVVMLVEASVSDAYQLKDTKEGPKLHQALTIDDLWVLRGKEARELVKARKTELARPKPDLAGTHPLGLVDDSAPPAGYVDASGVAMTPSEVAAQRGVQLPDAFVVEFLDGARYLWPDDWEGSGQGQPVTGGLARKPGELEALQVVKLLDPETGDVLDAWSDEDEEARLVAAERAAEEEERAEAAADREVGDELEAPRRQAWAGELVKLTLKPAKVRASELAGEGRADVLALAVELEEARAKPRGGLLAHLRALLVELGGEG